MKVDVRSDETRQNSCVSRGTGRLKALRTAAVVLGVAALLAKLEPATAQDPDPASTLVERKGCLQCHDPERARIGPAFQAIADRYRGDPEAASRLSDWLETGGRGHWGEDYQMSEQSHLRPGEAEALVKWVLRQ